MKTQERKKRMEMIKNTMMNAFKKGKNVGYEKMIAFCMYNFGVSRRDARDELNAVITIEDLKKEGDEIKNEK